LYGVDAQKTAASNGYPITVQVMPLSMPIGAAVEKGLGDRIKADLADRLSLFSGLRVLAFQPSTSKSDRARYVVGGEIRSTDGVIRILLRLTNDGHQVLIDQAQLSLNPRDYEDLLIRWANKLHVMMTLFEGSAAQDSKETSEPTFVRKGQAASFRGLSRKNYTEALSSFEEALRLNPDSVPAMIGIASRIITGGANFVSIEDERTKQLGRADQLLQRAVELEPRSEAVHFWIGQVHNGRGELELALRSFERSLELNPSFVQSVAGYGNALARMGRYQEGIDKIAQAVRLAPNHPGAGTWIVFWARAEIEIGNEAFARELLLLASQKDPGNARIFGLWAAADALGDDSVATAEHLAKFKSLSGTESLDLAVNRLKAQVVGPRTARGLVIALQSAF
jgi:tetratricopeptide (TPR) repeat protein